jgi:hypothetical protein
MSDEQRTLQQELVARYDRLRSSKVDPRLDNALAITTDGRKLALDARMLSATATDFAGSKINDMVDKVAAIWQRTQDSRGTQMIFCLCGAPHKANYPEFRIMCSKRKLALNARLPFGWCEKVSTRISCNTPRSFQPVEP